MSGTLLRYRVMAYVVGCLLIPLYFVALPMHYLAHDDIVGAIIGPLHGVLYLVYLMCVIELGFRARLSATRLLLMVAAGLLPFLSFIVERSTTAKLRAELAAEA